MVGGMTAKTRMRYENCEFLWRPKLKVCSYAKEIRANETKHSKRNSIFTRAMYYSPCTYGKGLLEIQQFQSAFRSIITWNFIFEVTYCRRIILIFFLLKELL